MAVKNLPTYVIFVGIAFKISGFTDPVKYINKLNWAVHKLRHLRGVGGQKFLILLSIKTTKRGSKIADFETT